MSFLARLSPLSDRIYELWGRQQRNPYAFGDACAEALRKSRLHECFDEDEVLDLLSTPEKLPSQRRLGLGSPSILLHEREDFAIRLEYRTSQQTTIHNHIIRGAYLVLRGKGLYALYSFEDSGSGDSDVQHGDLRFNGSVLLRPGGVGVIEGVHQVCNLTPLQINIRIVANVGVAVNQTSYLPPGLAYIHHDESGLVERTVQMLRLLNEHEPSRLLPFLEKLGPSASSADLILYAKNYSLLSGSPDGAVELCRRWWERSPRDWMRAVEPSTFLQPVLRTHMIKARSEASLQLCQLVTLIPSGAEINRILRSLYPDRPPGEVLLEGCAALLSEQEAPLETNGPVRKVVSGMLEGVPVETLLETARSGDPRLRSEDLRQSVDRALAQLEGHPVTRTLLQLLPKRAQPAPTRPSCVPV